MNWTCSDAPHARNKRFTKIAAVVATAKRVFNVWRGKYYFNLTVSVSDVYSHVAFSLLYYVLLIFLAIFFFTRIKENGNKYKFHFEMMVLIHSLSMLRLSVYFRGCACVFFMCGMFFLIILDLVTKFVLFWLFFACTTSISLIHFDGVPLSLRDSLVSFCFALFYRILTCRINLTTSVCTVQNEINSCRSW